MNNFRTHSMLSARIKLSLNETSKNFLNRWKHGRKKCIMQKSGSVIKIILAFNEYALNATEISGYR